LIDDERHDPGRVVLSRPRDKCESPDISPLTM
jgi:hypothetical protein